MFCEGLSGKFSSASYFFKNTWKLQNSFCFGRKTLDLLTNTSLLQFYFQLVPNFSLNIKFGIAFLEKCQIQSFSTFLLLWISNLTIRNAIKILKINNIIFKRYRACYELKMFFSDNPSQNMLRFTYKLKQIRTFMESHKLILFTYLALLSVFYFWNRNCALDYAWFRFWYFAKVFLCPKILILKSYDNTGGKSYNQLLVIIM